MRCASETVLSKDTISVLIFWNSLQRALVEAFSPSPSLAAELVRKAQQLQQMQVGLTMHQLFSTIHLTSLLLVATLLSQA